MKLNEITSNKLNFDKVLNKHCDHPIDSFTNPLGIKTSSGPKLVERSTYELGTGMGVVDKSGMILHCNSNDFIIVLADDHTYSIVSMSCWATLIEGIPNTYVDDVVYGLGFIADSPTVQGEISMNFNEALRAMLKGKKVRADCWEPNEYIMLDADNNDFIDENGDTYLFSDSSTYHDWHYSYSMAGTVLKHNNGNFYKIVVSPDNTYSIVNTEIFMVVREHIRADMLGLLLRVEGYTPLHMCDFNI